ncbi:MAG: BatA and WFA domain-containing protein [Pedobacter sp.]|nr:BatA and WFA domain-containing protein [Pedobacter sp.]
MNFLYPGFLFALLTVAIPVIIHLFNFRKFKKVYFSNVAFLHEVKERHSSRERLKNLLILLFRILTLIFLVLAFCRPYVPSGQKVDQNKSNTVSIYLDNSYSMEAVNKEGSLLDEAKRKAKEIVKAYEPNDRFQLLTNDFEGRHQRLLNAEEMLQAIVEIRISAASRQLQQVINRQESVFTGTNNRFSYIISDFQLGFSGEVPIKTSGGTNTSLIKLNANELPNVAVDSIWLLSPVHQPRATEKLVVQLRNYSDEEATNIPLKLFINQQQKAISSLTIPAGKTQRDTLSYSGLAVGWQQGVVSIKDFPLTFDDELNFSFQVNANQRALSINGPQTGNYISALFRADPYFSLTEMPESNINYSALSSFSVVILNGLGNPSSGLAQELKSYLNNGGTIVIFPALGADRSSYSKFLTAIQLPAVKTLVETPTKVSSIELKHPLFKEVFESLPQQLDLPQVNQYFTYEERSSSNKENLLQLPANSLFFARYQVGNGVAYLSATGLDERNGNFAKHPVFVPLMYKIAFSSAKDQPIYYTALKDNVLESQSINLGANQSLKLVADGFEIIPEVSQRNGKARLYVADQVKKAGFYAVKKGDSVLSVVAFNDNRKESNMHYSSTDDLRKLFSREQVTILDPRKDHVANAVSAKNKGTELWKLCLILALVFIATEILLVRLMPNKISIKAS